MAEPHLDVPYGSSGRTRGVAGHSPESHRQPARRIALSGLSEHVSIRPALPHESARNVLGISLLLCDAHVAALVVFVAIHFSHSDRVDCGNRPAYKILCTVAADRCCARMVAPLRMQVELENVSFSACAVSCLDGCARTRNLFALVCARSRPRCHLERIRCERKYRQDVDGSFELRGSNALGPHQYLGLMFGMVCECRAFGISTPWNDGSCMAA